MRRLTPRQRCTLCQNPKATVSTPAMHLLVTSMTRDIVVQDIFDAFSQAAVLNPDPDYDEGRAEVL